MGTDAETATIARSCRSPAYQKWQNFLPCSCLVSDGGEYDSEKTITNDVATID